MSSIRKKLGLPELEENDSSRIRKNFNLQPLKEKSNEKITTLERIFKSKNTIDEPEINSNLETLESLKKRKEQILQELPKHKKENKDLWWSEGRSFLGNIGNALYNLIDPKYEEKKYIEDERYYALEKELNEINNQIDNYNVNNKNYSSGFIGGVEKANDTFVGNIRTATKGIESTTKKILGQTPSKEMVDLSLEEKLAQKAKNESTGVGSVALDVWGGIARMVPQMAVGNPTGSTIMGFANYGGGAYNEAINDGYTDEQATKYGLAIGTAEMAMTKVLGSFSNIYGKNKLGQASQKIIDKFIPKLISNKQIRNVLSQMISEGGEEFVQEYVENIVKDTLLDEKGLLKSSWENITNEENLSNALYSGFIGSLTGGIMSAPTEVSKYNYEKNTGRNAETGLSINEQKVFDTEVKNRIDELQKNGEKLSKKQITEIENQVESDLKRGNITLDTIESILGGEKYNDYKKINDRKDFLESKIKELENKKITETTVKDNETLQNYRKELSELDIDNVKNKLSTEVDNLTQEDYYLRESYNNKTRRSQKYTADVSKYDIKQQATIQKAIDSGILNDTNQTHDFVDLVAKLSADKGVEFDFTNNERLKNSEFSIKDKTVNGYVKGNTIGLNIDSNKALNKVVGHEITHVLEGTDLYSELQQAVKEYATTKGEYDARLKDLTELYKNIKDANIENELTADLVGDYIFTDTDFIKNLSATKPNLFQKIYNEIKYLYKLATAGSKEARQLEKVKKTFEDVYKESFKVSGLKENIKYSIKKTKSGTEYIDIDTDQDIFEGIEEKDYNKIAKMYINDYLKGETALAHNDNAVIDSTTAKKYTNPGKRQPYFNEKMKLTPELKNVLEISEKINSALPTKSNTKYPNWEYYKIQFKLGNKTFEGKVNIGIDNNGNKHLYEVNNIKKTSGISETSPNSPTGFREDNIPQNNKNVKDKSSTKYSIQNKENNTQELDNSSFSLKEKQLEIIQNSNSMLDDYHTGIRNVNDIKTLEETINDNDWSDYDEYNPDLTRQDIEEAIKKGKIIVYSSYPIKQGTFVSPSRMEAESYSGNGKVYSKEVNINDIAWIDPTQGQYAKIKYSISNQNDIAPINPNLTYGKDIKLQVEEVIVPIKETINNLSKQVETISQDIAPVKKAEIMQNTAEDTAENVIEKENTQESAKLLDSRPLKHRKSASEQAKKLYQMLVDKGKYVSDLAKKTNNPELYAKYDQMGTARGTAEYSIAVGQVDNNGKIIGKSLIDIWQPITESGKEFDFSMYLLHKHNIDRYAQGKPVFGEDITSEISQEEVNKYEQKNPEFIEWSKEINTYNKNLLQNMVDAGLTSEESQKYYNDTYSNYVRIYRDMTGNNPITMYNGKLKVNNPIKTAKGGNQDIQPLKDSMAQHTLDVTNAIRRNQFGLELYNTLGEGENVTEYGEDIIAKNKDGSYTFTVFDKGQPVKLTIDEGLYESIKPTAKANWEDTIITKGTNKLLQFQRGLITDKNPLFLVRNFFKDLGDAPLNSKYGSKFFKNFVKAYNEIATNGEYAQLYKAMGGYQQSYFDNDKGLKMPSQKVSAKFVQKIQSLNHAVEMAPRLAEFISSIESGDSVQTAMYNAAEITTNFKRGGETTKKVNKYFSNFLNASVQGFDKQFRNFTGQNGAKGYINLLLKATAFGIAPSLLNHLLLEDDEEYEELPDYIKDNYYLFKTNDEGDFIRIPKGRVVSVFGNAARRTIEYANGDKKAFKGYLSNVATNVAPNNPLESNVLSTFTQVATNKSWNKSDIVPQRLQNLPAAEQFDEKTDEISKWIGRTFNISPKKVNYILDQYSGVFGDVFLPMMTPQAEQNPFTSAFTVNSTTTNKYSSEFYDVKDELTEKSNSVNATNEDILKTKYMNSVQTEMNELYKEKREIQMSNMTDEEKRKEVKKIQSYINQIAEEALNNYESVKVYSNYSKIADKEFYIGSDGEWTKVKTEDMYDLEDLNMNDEDKNNYFKAKNNISNIKKDISSEDRKSFIINEVINSNLNDEQKAYLYDKYYASTDKLNIVVKSGIGMDEYLVLEAQNFQADKYPNGKTVTGSKKNKVFNYINSTNLGFEQKVILAKMYYPSYDEYNYDIINYLNDNENITYDDMKNILETLGFKVKGNNITWD